MRGLPPFGFDLQSSLDSLVLLTEHVLSNFYIGTLPFSPKQNRVWDIIMLWVFRMLANFLLYTENEPSAFINKGDER